MALDSIPVSEDNMVITTLIPTPRAKSNVCNLQEFFLLHVPISS